MVLRYSLLSAKVYPTILHRRGAGISSFCFIAIQYCKAVADCNVAAADLKFIVEKMTELEAEFKKNLQVSSVH